MKGVGVTRHYKATAHLCHVPNCPTTVPPRMLMCLHHWLMVPSVLKRTVWRLYVPGQETRKDPTPEYLKAAKDAIAAVVKILERAA